MARRKGLVIQNNLFQCLACIHPSQKYGILIATQNTHR